MGGDVLKKFGRYFLLDQMAQGGMAEIYRARLATVDGAGRLLVIKRIQAGYGGDREFLQMFKSEIKVTMGLNHPNIVQLYDFGEENGQPYIAMEFVDGKNLRQFMSRFNELKQPVPVELAVHVIEQAASGLHYAHNFKDKLTGQPLNIVHRDISPQNVLISYEGNVKVIDFGIAKATTNVESTRQNVIKGKPSYLSPEQISGETLDGRSDVFSLGTVLWEILAGKKLFSGDNDRAVLMQIESCSSFVKPPSTLNPRVPKELDYIVMKSLAKTVDKRFQTAEEFQRALHKFLYNYMPEFNPSDLGYIAKDLFSVDIVEDRKRIQRLNEDAERLLSGRMIEIQTNRATVGNSFSDTQPNEDTTTVACPPRKAGGEALGATLKAGKMVSVGGLELGDNPARRKANKGAEVPSGGNSKTKGLDSVALKSGKLAAHPSNRMQGKFGGMGAALWLLLISATGAVYAPELGFRIPVVSDLLDQILVSGQAQLTLDGRDRNVAVLLNGKNAATSLPVTLKVPAGKKLNLQVTGAGGTYEEELVLKPREQKAISVALSQGAGTAAAGSVNRAPAGEIPLRLNMIPPGGNAAISINGKAMDKGSFVMNVPMDTPLELVVERAGYKLLKREFFVESRQAKSLNEFSMDVLLEPIRYGFISIRTTPSATAFINIDGKEWAKSTPFEEQRIPAGTYTIRLVNEHIGMEKTVVTTVQDGANIVITEQLKFKN